MSERDRYRQKLSKVYDDTFESAKESAFNSAPTRNIDGLEHVPIGLLIEIEEEAASDAVEAVAAQVIRDLAQKFETRGVSSDSEVKADTHAMKVLYEFARERGIDLEYAP